MYRLWLLFKWKLSEGNSRSSAKQREMNKTAVSSFKCRLSCPAKKDRNKQLAMFQTSARLSFTKETLLMKGNKYLEVEGNSSLNRLDF